MAIRLRKPYALCVATYTGWAGSPGVVSHDIRGGYSYTSKTYTVCGREVRGIESRWNRVGPDHTLPVTCKSCLKGSMR